MNITKDAKGRTKFAHQHSYGDIQRATRKRKAEEAATAGTERRSHVGWREWKEQQGYTTPSRDERERRQTARGPPPEPFGGLYGPARPKAGRKAKGKGKDKDKGTSKGRSKSSYEWQQSWDEWDSWHTTSERHDSSSVGTHHNYLGNRWASHESYEHDTSSSLCESYSVAPCINYCEKCEVRLCMFKRGHDESGGPQLTCKCYYCARLLPPSERSTVSVPAPSVVATSWDDVNKEEIHGCCI